MGSASNSDVEFWASGSARVDLWVPKAKLEKKKIAMMIKHIFIIKMRKKSSQDFPCQFHS